MAYYWAVSTCGRRLFRRLNDIADYEDLQESETSEIHVNRFKSQKYS